MNFLICQTSAASPAEPGKLPFWFSDVGHAESLAALMTLLRDFIDEIGSELDARTDKPLAPHHWIRFVKLLAEIDQDDEMSELRQQMEQIVSKRDVRFQDRCLALIALLSADPALGAVFTRRRHAAITALAAL
jgi:hypothetical protein